MIDFLKTPRNRVIVVLAFFLLLGVGPCGWFQGNGSQLDLLGAEVRRGPLTISVVQRGNLSA